MSLHISDSKAAIQGQGETLVTYIADSKSLFYYYH